MQTRRKSRHTRKASKRTNPFFLGCLLALIVIGIIFTAIKLFVDNEDDFMKSQYPLEYCEYVEKYSEEYGVSKALVYAVIRTESGFNKDAGSSAGALGLMQIIPDTFDWLQLQRNELGNYETEDLFTPKINIDYGVYFLSWLLEKYDCEETAVAAYNAGFGAVDDWLSDPQYSSDGVSLDAIPYPETEAYVKKVESAKEMYSQLYGL